MPSINIPTSNNLNDYWNYDTPTLGTTTYQTFYTDQTVEFRNVELKKEVSKVDRLNKTFEKIFLEIYADPDTYQIELQKFLNYVQRYADKQ